MQLHEIVNIWNCTTYMGRQFCTISLIFRYYKRVIIIVLTHPWLHPQLTSSVCYSWCTKIWMKNDFLQVQRVTATWPHLMSVTQRGKDIIIDSVSLYEIMSMFWFCQLLQRKGHESVLTYFVCKHSNIGHCTHTSWSIKYLWIIFTQ